MGKQHISVYPEELSATFRMTYGLYPPNETQLCYVHIVSDGNRIILESSNKFFAIRIEREAIKGDSTIDRWIYLDDKSIKMLTSEANLSAEDIDDGSGDGYICLLEIDDIQVFASIKGNDSFMVKGCAGSFNNPPNLDTIFKQNVSLSPVKQVTVSPYLLMILSKSFYDLGSIIEFCGTESKDDLPGALHFNGYGYYGQSIKVVLMPIKTQDEFQN